MSLIELMHQIRQAQFCERDGFPIIEIDGEHYCSVEYADGLIGGQRVVGVAQGQEYMTLLFANGYEIPLSCPCCAGPLHLKDLRLGELRALLTGRTLVGFRHGEWAGRQTPPDRRPVFALEFSGNEERSTRTIEVSLESVRRISKSSLGDAGNR
jgi:hypothetical protein